MEMNAKPMEVRSVRFGALQHRLIEEEAAEEGVSASQFIRDAAFARAIFHRGRRRPAEAAVVERFYELMREVSSVEELLASLLHVNPPSAGSDGQSPDGPARP